MLVLRRALAALPLSLVLVAAADVEVVTDPNVTLDAATEIGHATAGGGFVWYFGTVEIEQGCTPCPPL